MKIEQMDTSKNPDFISISLLTDKDNLLSSEIIGDLWIYFRLNNTESLKLYPQVSHLKLNYEHNCHNSYNEFFEPLFLSFIDYQYATVDFLPNFGGQGCTIVKNDSNFLICTIKYTEDKADSFINLINEETQNVNYSGKSYLVIIRQCYSKLIVS